MAFRSIIVSLQLPCSRAVYETDEAIKERNTRDQHLSTLLYVYSIRMFVCSCFLNEALLPCAEFSLRGCSEYLQCINCSNKWNETKDSFLCIYLVSTKPKFFIAKEGFFFKNCSAPYISVYLTYRHALFHISSVVGFTVISELKITVGAYCADVKCLLVTKVGTKIGIYNGGGVIPAPDQIWTFVKTLMNLRATEGAVDFFVS